MADGGGGGGGGGSGVTADDEDSKAAPNTFNNDGSFMEQFIKMQKEKEAESAKNKAPSSSNAQLVKKKAPTSLVQKMIKNRVAKKLAASAGKKNVGSNNDNNATKEEPDPSTTPSSSSLSSSTSSSSSSTITDTPSSSTITSPTPPPPTTTSLLSASAKKGGRKRKSKWDVGSSEPTDDSLAIHEAIGSFSSIPTPSSSSSLSSSSMAATGGAGGGGSGGQHLTPDQLQQIREQIAMQKMVAEIKSATAQSTAAGTKQNRYEYDSDEDTDGGTWEHKTRLKEMRTSEDQAKELTEMGKGKHHIGDFLPPEEMEKFVETVNAVKEDRDPDLSDYKEHKLTEDNIGFKLLQKSGWDEGTGLGAQQQGITAPVNKGKQSFDQSGVGVVKPAEVKKSDDEFDLYRKRMMLAYRFRPNPLNNPRRPYY